MAATEIDALRERCKDPKERDARLALARELVHSARRMPRGDDDRLAAAAEAVELDPYCAAAWRELAHERHRRADFPRAHDAYLEAIRLLPEDARLLAHHGLLLLEAFRDNRDRPEALEMALDAFEAAYHIDPEETLARYGLLDARLEAPDAESLRRIADQLIAIPPQHRHVRPMVARYLKWVLSLPGIAEESDLLTRVSATLKQRWQPVAQDRSELAWLDAAPAIRSADAEEVIARYPDWRRDLSPGALVAALVGERIDEAGGPGRRLALIERMLEKAPDDPFLNRARLYNFHIQAKRAVAIGEDASARQVWESCRQLDPTNDRILQNLALLELRRGVAPLDSPTWELLTHHWAIKGQIFPQTPVYLELLGLKSQLFAERLFDKLSRETLQRSQALPLAERWLSSSILSVVLRGLAIRAPELEPIEPIAREDLRGFLSLSLRSLLELTEASLFEPPRRLPPFLYDRVGLRKDADQETIDDRLAEGAFPEEVREVLGRPERRRVYDRQTLSWQQHLINGDKAQWLLRLRELIQAQPSTAMTFLVQLITFSYDFATLRDYFEHEDPELYARCRKDLIDGYCADAYQLRFDEPEEALRRLADVAGSLDRWRDPIDCAALAEYFNEIEFSYMTRKSERSAFNGIAKGFFLLKRAEQSAGNIETRAMILQQMAEIEIQEPSDIIATASDGDPELKRRLTIALNAIRARKYDQARQRLESILKRKPNECGALLMMAKITMEEAALAYRLNKDFNFLTEQLAEARQLLQLVMDGPKPLRELEALCKRMIWKINGELDKARAERQTPA